MFFRNFLLSLCFIAINSYAVQGLEVVSITKLIDEYPGRISLQVKTLENSSSETFFQFEKCFSAAGAFRIGAEYTCFTMGPKEIYTEAEIAQVMSSQQRWAYIRTGIDAAAIVASFLGINKLFNAIPATATNGTLQITQIITSIFIPGAYAGYTATSEAGIRAQFRTANNMKAAVKQYDEKNTVVKVRNINLTFARVKRVLNRIPAH